MVFHEDSYGLPDEGTGMPKHEGVHTLGIGLAL